MSKADNVRLAAESLADLNVFHAIIAICEGGCLHSPSYSGGERIIKICKAEAGKRLREFDLAVFRAARTGEKAK